ncbi:NADH dehydrogenase [Sporolactobacillus inulinus]|uniref:NADH dehydrogenase n=1 Tax=Sporolactobacillus inulinus TaxID=2078 RepID=A0A4Y1ZC45_9BACL|nr:NADH dehydrogenase [Sporolactobacillus inulinus]
MMKNKNIIIIGAGYAGVHAAKKLAKTFKKRCFRHDYFN